MQEVIVARPTSKSDLISASQNNFEKLNVLIASLTEVELSTPFGFAADEGKKEAHWARDKNLRDVLIHLHEWHQLVLVWVSSNTQGEARPFLPSPYNWKTYGEMNVEFWTKHQDTPLEAAKSLYVKSHDDVMRVAEGFPDAELFTKDAFSWVGGSTLGSYFVSATASHYDWAMKKLKAHRKNCVQA